MLTNSKRAIAELLDEMHAVRSRLDRIDAALVVRDPGNARSVEAYEGLRNQVAMSASSRRTHLVQLASFTEALQQAVDIAQLQSLVSEWSLQAGLERLEVYVDGMFKILNPEVAQGAAQSGAAVIAVIVSPGWRDRQTGALVKQGTCIIEAAPVEEQPAAASNDSETSQPAGSPEAGNSENGENAS